MTLRFLNNVSIISEAFEIIPEYKDFAENRGIDPSSSVTQDMIENPVNFYTDALSNISKAIDIVQDMYVKVFDELTSTNLLIENLIVNNKPHFGVIKRIIKQLM